MASNLSLFPEQIDSFIRHYDIGATDVPNVERYQLLKSKDTLTSVETEEMNSLLSALREKIWIAEDLNKVQDALVNLETFFKYQTETYIEQLFAQYDSRMDTLEANSEALIQEITDKITETNAWIDNQMATLHDSQYFNFDNMSYRAGFTRKTQKQSDTVTVETIYNKNNNSVYATRTTTKNGEQDYTIVTVCNKVEPAVNSTVHTYKDASGNWIEDVT